MLRFLVLVALVAAGVTVPAAVTAPAAVGRVAADPIAHDPSIARQGRYFYSFSTGDRGQPHTYLPVRRSTDLLHWESVGPVFTDPPAWVVTELGTVPPDFWAPDITY